jgi:VIT1/CCC1 family predicted Fe2+/Mn2+ transporter
MSLKEVPSVKAFLQFFYTYLEPAERLSEVLFGLIMVISIISTVDLILPKGGDIVGDLLKATIGCNTAWGIVDGVFYILNNVMQRSQRLKIIQKVRQSKNPEEALSMIAIRLDTMINPLVDSSERDQFYKAIYKKISQAPLETGRFLKEDLMGAVASFFLVFLSTFPVAIPFLVIPDPRLALKISYMISLILLFIVGYRWGHFAMVKPIRPALGMVLIGVILILITIALGG